MLRIFLIYIVVLCASCATVIPPTGGAKDSVPPVFLKAMPASNCIHFNAKKITLYFDEYIELKTGEQQVFMIPDVEKKIAASAINKLINIEINDTLAANTTYVIYFKEAIADITEKNVLPQLTYAFSTSDHIDTGVVRIKIQTKNTEKEYTKYIAQLYNDTASMATMMKSKSNISLHFGKTDEVAFTNLTTSKMNILVFNDANNNGVYDAFKEWVGFRLSDDTTQKSKIPIALFMEKSQYPILIKSNYINETTTQLIFNQPTQIKQLQTLSGEPIEYAATQRKDTLLLWHPPVAENSKAIITHGSNQIDTIDFSKNNSLKRTKAPARPMLTTSISNGKISSDTLYVTLYPIKEMDVTKLNVTWLENEKIIAKALPLVETEYKNQKSWAWIYTWKANASYRIVIPAGQAQYAFGDTFNDTIRASFKRLTSKDLGAIVLPSPVFESTTTKTVLYIENTKTLEKLVYKNPTYPLVVSNVAPGGYQVSMLIDANGNGEFDTGDLKSKKQPEVVRKLIKIQEVKSGFTTTVTGSKK